MKNNLKYFLNKFTFLKTYFSPFKPIKPKFHFGKVKIGVPIFYPRMWKKHTPKTASKKALEEPNNYMKDWSFRKKYDHYIKCQHAIPKKVGFDFVSLRWKTKWSNTDIRHETDPVWSFVFFGWQLAIVWSAPFHSHYWEAWLTYHYFTDKKFSVQERIKLAREITPNIWTSHYQGKKETIDYWTKILKNKYL